MGIVRRNGKLYYYENRRIGGRVVSEYMGSGGLALLARDFAQENAYKKAAERERFRRKIEELAALDADLDCIFECVKALSTSEFILSGYHNHKGQWRKRRDEKHNKARGHQTRQAQ
jgi:hypothetical protein